MRLFLALVACAGLAACQDSPAPGTEQPGPLWNVSGTVSVQRYVDPLTGCHYMRPNSSGASLKPRMQIPGTEPAQGFERFRAAYEGVNHAPQ